MLSTGAFGLMNGTYPSDKRVSGGNRVMLEGFLKCCWYWIFVIWHIVFCILSSILELCDCFQDGMASQIDNMSETPLISVHVNINQFART